jgi:hypothetical protein
MTTSTMTVPIPAHAVAVVSDGFEYLAECACGWAGDWQASPQEADAEGSEHSDAAIGPPDEMDLLVSALLDLQEDLAATVVWLAENWSAYLPALGWYANGDGRDSSRPALRVIGACDPDELPAAAEVLGARPADDPPSDVGVTRYRRAVRDIGRVRIEVFAPFDRCGVTEPAA